MIVKELLEIALIKVSLLGLAAIPGEAAVIPADSPSRSDVISAISESSDGDIVLIPAGTATWTEPLKIERKAIILKGSGIGKTIIINGVENDSLIDVTCAATGRIRITGFEFRSNFESWGIAFGGDKWGEYQVDDCKFVKMLRRSIYNFGLLKGLIYDCTFVDCGKTVDTMGGKFMNESWEDPLTLGTAFACVVEDCNFIYTPEFPPRQTACSSRGQGGRAVWRHNNFTSNKVGLDFFPLIDCHGNQREVSGQNPLVDPPGGSGDHRGTRQFEMYGNNFHSDNGGGSSVQLSQFRGGVIIAFDNVFTGADMSTNFKVYEEDGAEDSNFLSEYPGYDPLWMWFWNNTSKGQPISSVSFVYSHDPDFIIQGTNLFWRQPQAGDPIVTSYTPLAYPHPWRNSPENSPPPPKTLEKSD